MPATPLTTARFASLCRPPRDSTASVFRFALLGRCVAERRLPATPSGRTVIHELGNG